MYTQSSVPMEQRFSQDFHTIVPFNPEKQKIARLDLSPANKTFTEGIYKSPENFDNFIHQQMADASAAYLIGGYAETRNMYLRSNLFDDNLTNGSASHGEPRNLHLGIDIWGRAGTPIFAPLGGMVHSMANNNHFGDYGPTIILQHQIDMFNFYTLYGHLAVTDLTKLRIGQFITRGETVAHFGEEKENGNYLGKSLLLTLSHYTSTPSALYETM